MKAFRAPRDAIGTLDADAAATLVASLSDVALVMDGEGIIQDMAFQQTDLSLELEGYGRWFGRPWSETVSLESQPKIETMLRDAKRNVSSGWRQVTHTTLQGRELPILYSAIRLKADGERIVALGRDLRAVAALQQRLVDAQMSVERDYAKLRFAETRYRLLFQTSHEFVLVLDAGSHRIVEANPAAAALLEGNSKRVIGRLFSDLFNAASRPRVQAFLTELRTMSRADDIEATLADRGGTVTVSASMFRQESATLLLVRLNALNRATALPADSADVRLAGYLHAAPDGFVLADAAGCVITANPSFIAMIEVAGEEQARGVSLESWFGRPGVDFEVMMANLRQHGLLRLYATTIRGAQGGSLDVETSAVALGQGKTATFGFCVRDIGRRLAAPARSSQELPHSAAELTELIGRVPLKDLVRETTDVIEKLCIEAALELTGDNRASAAEVLGLSRQSLYVKLRRFGFADTADDEA